MNSKLKLALATASSLMMTAPVAAQNPPPAAPAQGQAKDPMSEVVCQKQEIVGSRLATRRVCMTRQQWQEQKLDDRQGTERGQIPSAKNSPGG